MSRPVAPVPDVDEEFDSYIAASEGKTESADPLGSWAPVDLGPYLRGEVERPVPTVGLTRTDGLRLLYPGKEHTVFGEMECGKSWVCLASALAELDAGNTVAYVHFEEGDPGDTIERLLALGASPRVLGDQSRFRFIGAEDRVNDLRMAAMLAEPVPSLVIFDGVNEAIALHGQKINENEGAAEYRKLLVKPCTSVGASVLSADHVAKDRDNRGRTPIGGVHKGNGLSGVGILMENAEPFGREMRGRSRVYITKDRSGHLRRHGRPDRDVKGKTYIGELVVDDTQQFSPDLVLRFYAPTEKGVVEDETQDGLDELVAEETAPAVNEVGTAVVAVMRSNGGEFKSQNDLLSAMRVAETGYRKQAVKDALADLVTLGLVEALTGGKRRAVGYRITTGSQDQTDLTGSATGSATGSGTGSPKNGGPRDPVTDPGSPTGSDRSGPSRTQSDPVKNRDPADSPDPVEDEATDAS